MPDHRSMTDPASVVISPSTAVTAETHSPSTQLRIKFFLTGVVFPICCFIAAAGGMMSAVDEPWQSGQPKQYLGLLLTWPAFGPLLPLVGFSMVCMTCWVVRPEMALRSWVRYGIYGGLILAIQFYICVFFSSGLMSLFGAVIAGPVIAAFVFLAYVSGPFVRRFSIRQVMVVTALIAMMIAVATATNIVAGWREIEMIITGVLFWTVIAAPTLNCITYARAGLMVSNAVADRENLSARLFERTSLSILAAWWLSWLISWKVAIDLMLIEYSKLPTTAPNCYVSCAAAHGHRRLVRSIQRHGGWVNPQMQRLKFLEFALAAASPQLHQAIRTVYNSVGPNLATCCASNRWFADATFVMLKPLEWLAQSVQFVASVPQASIDQIYLSGSVRQNRTSDQNSQTFGDPQAR